jgi:acylphosphatase
LKMLGQKRTGAGDNGDVEALFEGEEDNINNVIDWLKHEHPHARVDEVNITRSKYTGDFDSFDIGY